MQFKLLIVSAIAGLASAYTQPKGDAPSGNAITSPLNQVVPLGAPFKIQWTPTTSGTVTLILLRGPAENAVYKQTIVEKIDNSGSYTWNVPSDLEPDSTHYGIELIVDATGQYQYSTQIGMGGSNEAYGGSASSSTTDSGLTYVTGLGTAVCGALDECPETTSAPAAQAAASSTTGPVYVTGLGTAHCGAMNECPETTTTAAVAAGTAASTGGIPVVTITPSGNMTVPSTLATVAPVTSVSTAVVAAGATTTVAAGGSKSTAGASAASTGVSTGIAAVGKTIGGGVGFAAFIAGLAAFL